MRNGITRAVLVGILGTSLTGCSLLSENVEDVGKAAGKAVQFYCKNVSIPEVRDEIRATVNRYAAPHSIAVTCADTAPAQ
jgi:hypothetical protein